MVVCTKNMESELPNQESMDLKKTAGFINAKRCLNIYVHLST